MDWNSLAAGRLDRDCSDIDRIPRQQYFLRTVSQAAIDKAAPGIPPRRSRCSTRSSTRCRRPEPQAGRLKALIDTFRGLDPSRIEMSTLPTVGTTRRPQPVVVPKYPDADADAQPARGRSRTPPKELPVAVPPDRDQGARRQRLGPCEWAHARCSTAFVADGFHRASARPRRGDRSDYPHPDPLERRQAGKALTAASYLGTGNPVQARPDETGAADLLIIVGKRLGRSRGDRQAAADPNTTAAPPTHAGHDDARRRPAPTTTAAPPTTAPRYRSTR